jgi:diguanylate cyclase (GGDEF)-like protein
LWRRKKRDLKRVNKYCRQVRLLNRREKTLDHRKEKIFISSVSVLQPVSRMGGDEFVLLVTEVNETESVANNFAQKILENVRKPFLLNSHEVRITASIGISQYPDNGEDIEMLIKHADTAMYQAKREARNNNLVYKPGMSMHCKGKEKR